MPDRGHLPITSIDRFSPAESSEKVARAQRRDAINSAKISKNYGGKSAFNSAKAREDLSRFGN
jgi:hypothetical protein